jgi:chromosome segregation ATPase
MSDEPINPERPSLPPLPPKKMPPLPPKAGQPGSGAPAPSQPPLPPPAEQLRALEAERKAEDLEKSRRDLEKRLADMERQVQQEREKALLASLKSQEEATLSARVETSLKEVQDKLRRDRHEQEILESKSKLESHAAELENKLAQERETWVQTLKNQMRQRDVQEKEVETQFTLRLQDMERRILDEKAVWQKNLLSKEEELRVAKSGVEKLQEQLGAVRADLVERQSAQKAAEMENRTLLRDIEDFKRRHQDLLTEKAQLEAQSRAAIDVEKDLIATKGELQLARGQSSTQIDRLEKELQASKMALWEREQRVMAETERLTREVHTIAERVKQEKEVEIRALRQQAEASIKTAEDKRAGAEAALTRLQAVTTALEKELSQVKLERSQWAQVSQAQGQEIARLRKETAKLAERYHAEMAERDRRWQAREKELRAQLEMTAGPWMRKVEEAQAALKSQEDEFKKKAAEAVADWEKKWLEREREFLAEQRKRDDAYQHRLDEMRNAIESKGDAARGILKEETEARVKEAIELERSRVDVEVRERLAARIEELRHANEEAVRKAVADTEARVRSLSAASEAKLQAEGSAAVAEVEALRSALGRAEARLTEMESVKNQLGDRGVESQKLRDELASLKKELEKKEAFSQELARTRAAQGAALASAAEDARKKLDEQKRLKEQIDAAGTANEDLQKRLKEQTVRASDLQAALETLKGRLGESETKLGDLARESEATLGKRLDEVRSTLESRLSTLADRAAKAEKERDTVNQQKSVVEGQLLTNMKEVKRLQQQLQDDTGKHEEALKKLAADLDEQIAKLKSTSAEADTLRAELGAPLAQQVKRILGGKKKK